MQPWRKPRRLGPWVEKVEWDFLVLKKQDVNYIALRSTELIYGIWVPQPQHGRPHIDGDTPAFLSWGISYWKRRKLAGSTPWLVEAWTNQKGCHGMASWYTHGLVLIWSCLHRTANNCSQNSSSAPLEIHIDDMMIILLSKHNICMFNAMWFMDCQGLIGLRIVQLRPGEAGKKHRVFRGPGTVNEPWMSVNEPWTTIFGRERPFLGVKDIAPKTAPKITIF